MRPVAPLNWKCTRPLLNGLLVLWVNITVAAERPQADLDTPRPGLRAEYSPGGVTRIASDLRSAGAPDPRVPADGFQARYTGLLLIQSPGSHRFWTEAEGSIVLIVGGKTLLRSNPGPVDPGPIGSESIELAAGLTPIILEYRHDQGHGPTRFSIDWEGPGFGREAVPARLLFHEVDGNAPEELDRFETGRRLADRLGCANCHALLDLSTHRDLGPPLDDAGRTIASGWLAAWLENPARVRPDTRMPGLGHGLGATETADLLAYLTQAPSKKEPAPPSVELTMALNVANPRQGRLLFRSVGCLGCHTRGPDASGIVIRRDEQAGPDLSNVGRQRTAARLAQYLEHPRKKSNARSQHRADLNLSADESAQLAAYLVSDLDDPSSNANDRFSSPAVANRTPGDKVRGEGLANRLRCAACHEVPGLKAPPADLPIKSSDRVNAGCLADSGATRAAGVPRFNLSDQQRDALRALIAGLPERPSPISPDSRVVDMIRRFGCLGCHVRDGQGGTMLGPQLAASLASDAELGALKGTLTPPDLSSVGDKLRSEYLTQVVRGSAPRARPWLSVRMPVFRYAPGEAEAIITYFRVHDRIEVSRIRDQVGPSPVEAEVENESVTATKLFGQQGFGCVNCHVVAGRIPPGGEPETLGPDLSLAHRRMTSSYFHRWISNPQRIIPGTPMPQFLQPLPVAEGTLEQQLELIWRLLGSPRVAEATAAVSRQRVPKDAQRPRVVRDMVILNEVPPPNDGHTPRALAIGLANDQTLLLDTDRLAWLSFWSDGFLTRTKAGRLWEWHPEGERLWLASNRLPPVVYLTEPGERVILPGEVRERFGRFGEVELGARGVRLTYHLNPPQGSGEALGVEVEETIEPVSGGWVRSVRVVSNVLAERLRTALVVSTPGTRSAVDRAEFAWEVGAGSTKRRVELRVSGGMESRKSIANDPSAYLYLIEPDGPVRIQLTVKPGR